MLRIKFCGASRDQQNDLADEMVREEGDDHGQGLSIDIELLDSDVDSIMLCETKPHAPLQASSSDAVSRTQDHGHKEEELNRCKNSRTHLYIFRRLCPAH